MQHRQQAQLRAREIGLVAAHRLPGGRHFAAGGNQAGQVVAQPACRLGGERQAEVAAHRLVAEDGAGERRRQIVAVGTDEDGRIEAAQACGRQVRHDERAVDTAVDEGGALEFAVEPLAPLAESQSRRDGGEFLAPRSQQLDQGRSCLVASKSVQSA